MRRRIICTILIAYLGLQMKVVAMELTTDASDRHAIGDLVRSFSAALNRNQKEHLDNFFSPDMSRSVLMPLQELESKQLLEYSISNFNETGISFQNSTHAKVHAVEAWRTDGEEVEKDVDILFVKSGDKWYFQGASFLEPPSFAWILPLFLCAILHGIAITRMLMHIRRVQWKGSAKRLLWEVLAVVPGVYFLYLKIKPWDAGSEVATESARVYWMIAILATISFAYFMWVVHTWPAVVIETVATATIWVICFKGIRQRWHSHNDSAMNS